MISNAPEGGVLPVFNVDFPLRKQYAYIVVAKSQFVTLLKKIGVIAALVSFSTFPLA